MDFEDRDQVNTSTGEWATTTHGSYETTESSIPTEVKDHPLHKLAVEDKEHYRHKFRILHSQAAALRYSLAASAVRFDLLSQIRGQNKNTKTLFEDLSEEMASIGEELSSKNQIIKYLEVNMAVAQEEALC